MKIQFKFSDFLKFTVETDGFNGNDSDAFLIAFSALEKSQQLGYGSPKWEVTKDNLPNMSRKNEES